MRWGLIAALAASVLLPEGAVAQESDWVFRILRESARTAPRAPYVPEWQPETPRFEGPAIPRSTIREPMPARVSIPGKVIVVFVRFQQYSAYEDGRMKMFGDMALRGPVSTGSLQYLTPVTDPKKGAHAIDKRPGDETYVSKTYPEATYYRPAGGAKMPFSMFFDRPQGLAMHAGAFPREWDGYSFGLSHGCIRLPSAHAEILFRFFSDTTVRVVIVEDVATLARKWESVYVGSR